MKEGENLQDIINKMKGVEDGINGMIIPMLKDTINDYKKTFNKLIIIIIILIIGSLSVTGYSLYLVYKQSNEYKEFLSQFEFESEEVYQDIDAGDGSNSTINDGIQFSK